MRVGMPMHVAAVRRLFLVWDWQAEQVAIRREAVSLHVDEDRIRHRHGLRRRVLRAHHDTERGVAVKIAAYPAGYVDDTSHPSHSRTHVRRELAAIQEGKPETASPCRRKSV